MSWKIFTRMILPPRCRIWTRRRGQVLYRLMTAGDVLKNSKSSKKQAWLELMDPQSRTQFQALASYDEELIGSRMTTNFVTLQASLSIKEAMTSVISQAAEHDNPIFNSWRIKSVQKSKKRKPDRYQASFIWNTYPKQCLTKNKEFGYA